MTPAGALLLERTLATIREKRRVFIAARLESQIRDSVGLGEWDMCAIGRRFAGARLAKASEAGAILRVCLRDLGWSARYNAGKLTGRQRLKLLEGVRQYGRSWLHHEAMTLIERFQDSARSVGGEFVDVVGRAILPAAKAAVSRFFRRARTFVHELILAGAMAMGGPGYPSREELEAVDREAQRQWQYFDKFEQEVLTNPPPELIDLSTTTIDVLPPSMTSREFAARAESYGSSAASAGQNISRTIQIKQGIVKAERRYHDYPWRRPGVDPCNGCIEEIRKGWQPPGNLKPIGACECESNCHCYFIFSDDPSKPSGLDPDEQQKFDDLLAGKKLTGYTKLKKLPSTDWVGKRRPQDVLPNLPSGPGPGEKPKAKGPKPELKPIEPYNPNPLKPLSEFLKEAGSPYAAEDYEIVE